MNGATAVRKPGAATRVNAIVLLFVMLCGLPPQAVADELDDGIAAYRRKDYAAALRLLAPLAESGSAQAQLRLGQMFWYGQGVKEDNTAAFRWFSRSAAQGNAEAQVHLANLYISGLGVPPDEQHPDLAAAQWYFAAARQGHPEAQYGLGLLFLVGKGVQRDDAEALKWMQRAAAQGHADAKAFVSGYPGSR